MKKIRYYEPVFLTAVILCFFGCTSPTIQDEIIGEWRTISAPWDDMERLHYFVYSDSTWIGVIPVIPDYVNHPRGSLGPLPFTYSKSESAIYFTTYNCSLIL